MAAALFKLKNWFSRKSQSSRPLSLGPPPELLARYLQYKRLLAANSASLAIAADLQTKVNEGFPFEVHYVRQACERPSGWNSKRMPSPLGPTPWSRRPWKASWRFSAA